MTSSKRGNDRTRQQQRVHTMMEALGLSDFETPAECAERQRVMVTRFRKKGAQAETVEGLTDCTAETCGMVQCRDGCHYAARRLRQELVLRFVKLLEANEGPHWFVTIVHPKWSWPAIQPFDPERIRQPHQWLAARLEQLSIRNLLAVGAWEMVLDQQFDGSARWAGHLHLVVAGAHHDIWRQALKIKALGAYSRPVVIQPADAMGRRLAYCFKRYAERRVPYKDVTERANQRHLPLRTPEQFYFDHALCSLAAGARVFWFQGRLREYETLKTLIV